jgi:hypothetical protein
VTGLDPFCGYQICSPPLISLSHRQQIFQTDAIDSREQTAVASRDNRTSKRRIVGGHRLQAVNNALGLQMDGTVKNASRIDNFSLHGLKEERTLRNAFAHFARTTSMALIGSLAGAASALPPAAVAGDPVTARSSSFQGAAPDRATATPAALQVIDPQKRLALALMAEAERLAGSGQSEKAAVMARRAAAVPTTWSPGERNPQQLLSELA